MRIRLMSIALGVSVLYVLIHQFLLQFPAKRVWQYDLGMLIQALSLSYVAAFLFYFVHNHYPYLKTKEKFQRIIERELNDLWDICNALTYSMSNHSKTSVEGQELNKIISKQLRNLPVDLINNEKSNTQGITLDMDNKPIKIGTLHFDKWSEAIEYVHSNISNTLSKVINLKDVVDEKTIIAIFDLEKSCNDFRLIAKLYEENHIQSFENEFLKKQIIKFHESTNELHKYRKSYIKNTLAQHKKEHNL